jgi:hypothetical protein
MGILHIEKAERERDSYIYNIVPYNWSHIGSLVGELKDTERVLRRRFRVQTLKTNLTIVTY